MFEIDKIYVNHMSEPEGIDSIESLNWILLSDKKNVRQSGYQIKIWDTTKENVLFDSGKIKSSDSNSVKLSDQSFLEPLTKYILEIKVEDEDGVESEWKSSSFVTALIDESWKAPFIAISEKNETLQRAVYFKKEYKITKNIKSAYLISTAQGVYHFYINGNKVGSDELAPGWTSYPNHLLYQVYDVKEQLKEQINVLTAHVGPGWYASDLGWDETASDNRYGSENSFSCELYIVYEDGEKDILQTSSDWKAHYSPIVYSDIYDGEYFDENEIVEDCFTFTDNSDWLDVKIIDVDFSLLKPQAGVRIRTKEILDVKEFIVTPNGEKVLDFGQNMTGFPEVTINSKPGEEYIVRCFEILDKAGNVYLDNLRTAEQKLTYRANKDGQVVFRPYFTFQGFQYLWLEKWSGDVNPADFKAVVVHSDMERIGEFNCSNEKVNQLFHNILWGMKGNFLDVPTDCPQRDERLGWTGDAQVFGSTACQLMNTYTFFEKWLKDLALEQLPNGGIPHVIPDILMNKLEGTDNIIVDTDNSATGWADVAVINPWNLYLYYGDKGILEKQFDSMKAWIDFMTDHSENGTWHFHDVQFGDWVALDAEEGSYFGATPIDLLCAAYYAYSTNLFVKSARALGRYEVADEYEKLYDYICKKYVENNFNEEGHLKSQTQTSQVISLYFDLIPAEYKKNVASDLVKLIKEAGGHLVTGFLGTPYICFALSENGYLQEAYDLLLREEYPSWLYPVTVGATTIWEHWDGRKPDGSLWSPNMNSFNHYAYGAVGDWLFRAVAGINPNEKNPGYKHSIISPQIGALSHAKANIKTPYGEIMSSWENVDGIVTLLVKVPVNTTSTVKLMNVDRMLDDDGVNFEKQLNDFTTDIGSGSYKFKFKLNK